MPRKLLVVAELRQQLLELEHAFPSPQRPVPSDSDLRQGALYLVAAHAAIENAIEELCRRALAVSLHEFRAYGLSSPLLDALVDFDYWQRTARLPRSDSFEFISSKVAAIAAATKAAVARIDANNGIKRQNVLAMLLPFGMQETDFDDVALSALDSFGAHRGDVAHGRPLSARARANISIPGRSVVVWSPKALRSRALITSNEVRRQLNLFWAELVKWDRTLLAKSRCT